MANPVKGEVAFEVEGRSYRLVLDFNALCEVEEVLGAGGMDLARPKAIRAIFWASMLRHQPDATVQDAGDLIGALGLEEAGRVVAEAMNRSGLAGGDGEAPANPPKASRAASISRKR
jgi:hypothetical protein